MASWENSHHRIPKEEEQQALELSWTHFYGSHLEFREKRFFYLNFKAARLGRFNNEIGRDDKIRAGDFAHLYYQHSEMIKLIIIKKANRL